MKCFLNLIENKEKFIDFNIFIICFSKIIIFKTTYQEIINYY
jgi:hypothetical protein